MKLARNLLLILPPLLVVGCIAAQNATSTQTAQAMEPVIHMAEADPTGPKIVADPADPKSVEFFQTKIQPILTQNCIGCHSDQKHKGGLSLASREAIIKGGNSGPAAVPGDPDKSVIVKAVSYTDADLKMPPRHKLSDEQIADITHWIELGVPYVAADAPAQK